MSTRRFAKHRVFSYSEAGKTALLSPAQGRVLRLYGAYGANRSGGASAVGFLKGFADASWYLGTVSDADTPDITDETATIQAGGSVDIFTTTANDGFLVQSPKPFNLIGLSVTQGETGSPVYALEYYNGTAWVAVPMLSTPDLTSTGDKLYLFAPPADWAPGGTAAVGVTSTNYAIRIRATTAGGQAVQANAAWVAELLAYQDDVPHNGQYAYVPPEFLPEQFEAGEYLIPYFSVPNSGNLVTVRYFLEH